MSYRKRTLRKLYPTTREVAKLVGELESIKRKLKNLIPKISEIEFQAESLKKAKQVKLIAPGPDEKPVFEEEEEEE